MVGLKFCLLSLPIWLFKYSSTIPIYSESCWKGYMKEWWLIAQSDRLYPGILKFLLLVDDWNGCCLHLWKAQEVLFLALYIRKGEEGTKAPFAVVNFNFKSAITQAHKFALFHQIEIYNYVFIYWLSAVFLKITPSSKLRQSSWVQASNFLSWAWHSFVMPRKQHASKMKFRKSKP